MRWQGRQESDNVEDVRGRRIGRPLAMGGGIGTIVLILILAFLGVDPRALMNQMGGQGGGALAPQAQREQPPNRPEQEPLRKFVGVVLKDTEDVWNKVLPAATGKNYSEPTLVIFSGMVQSACGTANSAMGPFYCPADQKVYIDLDFLEDMGRQLGANGDFAQAYVIAHEVGHHVQNLLGTMDEVQKQRGRMSEEEYNDLSVRLELQADFYAGVWAHHAQKMKNILERGDIEEAMDAAAAVGDDRLQKRGQGYVVPESFTHGTSEQRARWFRKGLETGDMRQGDTFNARRP